MLRLTGVFRQVFHAKGINIKGFAGFFLDKLKEL
jgi:hypothetical protein